MDIKLTTNSDATIDAVITDRLGKVVHKESFNLKDFRGDDWHEFDYMGRSYELQTYDDGENLHMTMYNYGDTENPSDAIAHVNVKDPYPENE